MIFKNIFFMKKSPCRTHTSFFQVNFEVGYRQYTKIKLSKSLILLNFIQVSFLE